MTGPQACLPAIEHKTRFSGHDGQLSAVDQSCTSTITSHKQDQFTTLAQPQVHVQLNFEPQYLASYMSC